VRGYPPYDPRLMVKLLVYGYITGVRSSRGDREVLQRLGAVPVLGGHQRLTSVPSPASAAPPPSPAGVFLESLEHCQQAAWCGSGAWPSTGPSEGRTPHGEGHEPTTGFEERKPAQERDRGAVGTSEATDVRGTGLRDPAETTSPVSSPGHEPLAKIKRAKADLEEEPVCAGLMTKQQRKHERRQR